MRSRPRTRQEYYSYRVKRRIDEKSDGESRRAKGRHAVRKRYGESGYQCVYMIRDRENKPDDRRGPDPKSGFAYERIREEGRAHADEHVH